MQIVYRVKTATIAINNKKIKINKFEFLFIANIILIDSITNAN